MFRVLGGLASAARVAIRAAPDTPLNAQIGQQRRYGTAITSLSDYKRVRAQQSDTGTRTTINDIVLATVAGALRGWLLFRGESVTPSTTVRAMVPVSVRSYSEMGALGVGSRGVCRPPRWGQSSIAASADQLCHARARVRPIRRSRALVTLSGFARPPFMPWGSLRIALPTICSISSSPMCPVRNTPVPPGAALEIFPIVPLAEGRRCRLD